MSESSHWRNRLGHGGLSADREVTVRIPVHGGRDNAAAVIIAARIAGILEALRQPYSLDHEPLDSEDVDDLLSLLEQVHHVRAVLEGQEERLLELCHRKGASLRTLAAQIDTKSAESVRYKLAAIKRANRHGVTAAALDNDPLAAGEPVATTEIGDHDMADQCRHQTVSGVQIWTDADGKVHQSWTCSDCGHQHKS